VARASESPMIVGWVESGMIGCAMKSRGFASIASLKCARSVADELGPINMP